MPTPKLNELDDLRPALARIHQVEAAPERHQQWCTDSTGNESAADAWSGGRALTAAGSASAASPQMGGAS